MTNYIVLGVYEEDLLRPMAEVMQNLGVKQAMIVYGDDCLDEISISDTTSICEIRDGKLISYKISPEEFGISMAEKDSIKGGTWAKKGHRTSQCGKRPLYHRGRKRYEGRNRNGKAVH